MPHLSRKQPSSATQKILEKRLLVELLGKDKISQSVVRELLTNTERLMLAKRLSLILGIGRKIPTHVIAEIIKVSPSTVARFELACETGKFSATEKWLRTKNKHAGASETLLKLLSIPFMVRSHGLVRTLKKLGL